ncbi:MAG TPA: TetR/AcrR family transcriptional regulator [Thermoanaerobaculia bacterium]|jgi:AcrR family transcriptional regulator|nr:TetR/AcrR family transcriptional regulator [Thermoanaerobaculia bacterium]
MKIPNMTDRRVRRTRRLLRDALLELVLQRGWDDVSVSDICEHAEVGRSTFYTHFAHKEALLLSGFDDLREHLRAATSSTGNGRSAPFSFLRGLIEHVQENRRLFRAIVGKHAGQLAQKNFRQFVFGLVREDLAAALPDAGDIEAASRYISGGISELLIWSVDVRPARESTDLESSCLQLTKPILATLRR